METFFSEGEELFLIEKKKRQPAFCKRRLPWCLCEINFLRWFHFTHVGPLTPAAVPSESAVLPAAPRAVQSRATQHDRVEAFLRMQHWAYEQVWEVGAARRTSVTVAGGTVRVADLLATCHYVSARGKRRWIQLLAGRGGRAVST